MGNVVKGFSEKSLKKKLQRAGFQEEGHLHKLRYLERALEAHSPQTVFKRIGMDSYRKFREFASKEAPSGKESAVFIPEIKVTARRVTVDGINLLNFSRDISEPIREELGGYLKRIYEIRSRDNVPHIVDVYDEGEARAIENYLRRHRQEK